MAFAYDDLKLDKGRYQEAGRTITQVLESQDPSERSGEPGPQRTVQGHQPGGAGRLSAAAEAV